MITVVIPTYNRHKLIEKLINDYINRYKGDLFTFEIHDSSPNNLTKKIIDNYSNPLISYFKYDSSISADIKALNAINNVKTEYIYLMGDSVNPNFNKFEKYLITNNYEKYDVFSFREYALKKNTDFQCKEYNDMKSFFKDNFWKLTFFGSYIMKKNIFDKGYKQSEKYIIGKSPFANVSILFEGLIGEKKSCYFAYVDFITLNPEKKESGWMTSKQTIEFFCKKYYECLQLLPTYYCAMNPEELCKQNTETGLFSKKMILLFRWNGNLTFKIYNEYKYYIKKTVKNYYFLIFSLFIPKFFLSFIRFVIKVLRRTNK